MSKAIALACFLAGKGFGSMAYQYDLEDDTSCDDDLKIAQNLVGWTVTLVEMVELAYSITMEYPEDYEYNIYREFGVWYGDQMSENDDNAEPDDEECMEQLVELVMEEFNSMLNEVQQQRLKALLEAINH